MPPEACESIELDNPDRRQDISSTKATSKEGADQGTDKWVYDDPEVIWAALPQKPRTAADIAPSVAPTRAPTRAGYRRTVIVAQSALVNVT
jgi:hypothetical protein